VAASRKEKEELIVDRGKRRIGKIKKANGFTRNESRTLGGKRLAPRWKRGAWFSTMLSEGRGAVEPHRHLLVERGLRWERSYYDVIWGGESRIA